MILIAHRLSTIRNANWIFVIERGEIIEQGMHQDLLQLDGYYARLHKHQDGSYVAV